MEKITKAVFRNEADLCSTFIKQLPEGWTAYPETAGWDLLLVRASDGAQIGVEAKKTLNAEVLLQAVDKMSRWDDRGPDFRAVLVPYGTAGSAMKRLAGHMSITVIEMKSKEIYQALRISRYGFRNEVHKFEPELPTGTEQFVWREQWFECLPVKRELLPDYVPDVQAGASGPSQLSEWKIKAIKIHILIEKRGEVTIADFKAIGIDRRRFMEMGWIQNPAPERGVRGVYVVGPRPMNLRDQHPVNYPQIEADFAKWAPPEIKSKKQEGFL